MSQRPPAKVKKTARNISFDIHRWPEIELTRSQEEAIVVSEFADC